MCRLCNHIELEPISHFFYSDRLKLQFWDWGTEGKPALILVHGGLDHARNWDWVARALRDDYHVYALDLRGHGNSAWAPGALYSIAEHVLDLSALADIINGFPLTIIGHSLGGMLTLVYAGIYPDRVKKAIACTGRRRSGCGNGSKRCASSKTGRRIAIPTWRRRWRG